MAIATYTELEILFFQLYDFPDSCEVLRRVKTRTSLQPIIIHEVATSNT